MFNKGDKCVHYTKYGNVNIIEIGSVDYTLAIDTDNNLIYKSYHIITTNGVRLELDDSDGKIRLLKRTLTEEESRKFIEGFKKLGKKKTEIKERIKNMRIILPDPPEDRIIKEGESTQKPKN